MRDDGDDARGEDPGVKKGGKKEEPAGERVRSRKAKTEPKQPQLTDEEKRLEKAKLKIAASRKRRQEARERELANPAPVLPPPPVTCNDQELRFITEFLKDLNGSAAMLRAGITEDPKVAKVYASRYLDRPHVLMELSARRQALMSRQELSLERVLEELRRVGLTRLSDVVTWDDDGAIAIRPKRELTDDELSAIAEIEEIPGMFGTRLRVKMHKKVDALKDLRKYFSPTLAEARFGATGGGASMGGGPATIIVEGGPTGLEINIKAGGDNESARRSGEVGNGGRGADAADPAPRGGAGDRPAAAGRRREEVLADLDRLPLDRTHPAYARQRPRSGRAKVPGARARR